MRVTRPRLAFILVLVLAAAASATWLLQELRPCAALDIRLGRSGCLETIPLPDGISRAHAVSTASVGGRAAVVVETDDSTLQVITLSTENWQPLGQVATTDTEIIGNSESSLPRITADGTRLVRGYAERMGYLAASSTDGVRVLLDDRRDTTLEVYRGADLLRVIELPKPVSVSPMILSHDGRRSIVPLQEVGLTVWDVESGVLLFQIEDQRIWDYDWLEDNRTLITIWRDGETSMLALFRVER